MQHLLRLLRETERFVVVSHIHPDGDAVGSLVALTLGLQQLGKTVSPVLVSGVPTAFRYLSEGLEIATELPQSDARTVCVVLDASDSARTGDKACVGGYATHGMLAYIDHHPGGDLQHLAGTHFHEINASSTCELVYAVLQELGVKFNHQISTALLTGIYTDTGGFQHSNTSQYTLEISAELMRRGARLAKIVEEISNQKTIANLRLIGLALERLRITTQGRCTVSCITHKDLLAEKATDEDTTGIVSQLTGIPGSRCTLFLLEGSPGEIRGSLRTHDGQGKSVSVNKLAKLLGGGGHTKAAGFSIMGNLKAHGDGWHIVP